MNVRREHSLDTLAELASSDQREIRILDVFSGPGGVGFALRELFTAPGVNGWFCGVDDTDYAERYPGEFRHLDARDLTLKALGLDEPVDLVWLSPPCQAYARPSHVHYDDPKAVFPTFEDLGVRDLTRLGREYVIENVVGCDDLRDPVELNGVAFGERYVYRRLFETSFDLPEWSVRADPEQETVPMDSVGEKEYARVKGTHFATEWDKTEIRAAIPGKYVAYVLSHCPTLPAIEVPGGNVEYRKRGAGGGNASLGSFGGGA